MNNYTKWPIRYKFWRFLHILINRLAWKFVPTKNQQDPRNNHWIWKLNNWIADHYTLWFATNIASQISKLKNTSAPEHGGGE